MGTRTDIKPRFSIPGPLGGYLILTKLNRGGMADVYLAEPLDPTPEQGRWVALKTLLPNLSTQDRYVEMFTSEGRLGMLLKHPNIARTWDVLQVPRPAGPVYTLAMEYVHGRDLGAVARHFRRVKSRMPIPQALFIVEGVLRGLSYAHELRDPSGTDLHLVNRDISPPNIMVGFDGRVRLIDFGIAQATLDFRSQIGAIKGKLSYMSPEQVRGLPVDARSDLFSLTVVLYQLITGVEPFAGDSEFEQMERVRRAEAQAPSTLNRQITPALEALIRKGLAREPGDRYPDARAMLDHLEQIRADLQGNYGPLELASFMGSTFKGDMDTLHSRIAKARHIMHQMVQTGARVWSHEMGDTEVARRLPAIEDILDRSPELGGVIIEDYQPPAPHAPEVAEPQAHEPEPQEAFPAPAPDVDPDRNASPTSRPDRPQALPPRPEDTMPSWALPTLALLGVVIVILTIILGVRLMG